MPGTPASLLTGLLATATVLALLSLVVTGLAQVTQAVLRLRARNLHRGLERLVTAAISNAPVEETRTDPVAVVYVHGVGEQAPGDPLAKFLRSMRHAYPRAKARWLHAPPIAPAGGPPAIRAREITGLGRPVRVYEAYWADLLSSRRVRGTLEPDLFLSLPWFPQLNSSSGSYGADPYRPMLVRSWTLLLTPMGPLLSAALWGWRLVAPLLALLAGLWRFLRRRPTQGGFDGLLEEVRFLPEAYIGDVFNYVRDAGGEPIRLDVRALDPKRARKRPKGPGPVASQLTGVSREIVERFRNTVALAAGDGCSEIQVVAHSLGSLVAYQGLTRGTAADPGDATPTPITRFYTLGSPLEKIRFFWPKLVAAEAEAGELAVHTGGRTVAAADPSRFRWENFHSSQDRISGILEKYDLRAGANHECPGAGGFLTSHLGYLRSPTFLTVLSRALGIRLPAPVRGIRAAARPSRLRVATEYAGSVLLFVVLVCLTLVGLLLPGLMLGGMASYVLRDQFDLAQGWILLISTSVVTTLLYWASVTTGRDRAKLAHGEHWAPPRAT